MKTAHTPAELASICKTPERVEKWINSLRWFRGVRRSPKKSIQRNPIVVLHCMEGNSLERAWLFYETIRLLDYDCFIISVQRDTDEQDQGVCAFLIDNEFWYLCDKGLKRSYTNKLEHIPKLVNDDLDNWKEWAVINNRIFRVKTHKNI